MDEPKRVERALGLGLCNSQNVLTPEQLEGLDRDLYALHAARTGVRNSVVGETIH